MKTMTRDDCLALDAADPLAAVRDAFEPAADGRICLDGNSMGALPRTAVRASSMRCARNGRLTGGTPGTWPIGWMRRSASARRLRR